MSNIKAGDAVVAYFPTKQYVTNAGGMPGALERIHEKRLGKVLSVDTNIKTKTKGLFKKVPYTVTENTYLVQDDDGNIVEVYTSDKQSYDQGYIKKVDNLSPPFKEENQ